MITATHSSNIDENVHVDTLLGIDAAAGVILRIRDVHSTILLLTFTADAADQLAAELRADAERHRQGGR